MPHERVQGERAQEGPGAAEPARGGHGRARVGVGARAGAFYPPPSDQTMLNYELALAHATGRARVAVLNSSIFVAGATLPAARGHEAAEAECESWSVERLDAPP